MKTISVVLLTCSLTANLALGYLYFQRTQHLDLSGESGEPAGAKAAADNPGAKTRAGAETAARLAGSVEGSAVSPVVGTLDKRLAAALHGGNAREFVSALRQSGFPPNYIRDILVWQFGDTTRSQRYVMYEETIKRQPWRAESKAEAQAREKALNDLDGKNQPGTKEAFAGDPPPIWQLDPSMRVYGFLPADKIEAVHDIDNGYGDMARNASKGGTDPKVLQLLYEERHSDLAKILTPNELQQYDLNFSPSAQQLHRQLAAFQPTESEYHALYNARTEFDAKYPYGGIIPGTSATDDPQRRADEDALAQRYQAALGAGRYAEFQRSQDPGYRASYAIAEHYGLPPENAAAVFNLQESARRELEQLSKGTTAAVQSVVQSTKAGLTKLLGAQGANDYLRVSGAWLENARGAGVKK